MRHYATLIIRNTGSDNSWAIYDVDSDLLPVCHIPDITSPLGVSCFLLSLSLPSQLKHVFFIKITASFQNITHFKYLYLAWLQVSAKIMCLSERNDTSHPSLSSSNSQIHFALDTISSTHVGWKPGFPIIRFFTWDWLSPVDSLQTGIAMSSAVDTYFVYCKVMLNIL